MTTFGPLFVPEELLDAVSGRAWLQAMLEFESALARAEAAAGIVPADAAAAIADCCRADLYDFGDLLVRGRSVGSPPEPLVRALRDEAGGEAGRYVHWGATSQDVMDTASMLVARRALGLILAELDRIAGMLAALAEEHRSTPMAARTLLQQAVPTTFGCKTAGWLVALLEARTLLANVRNERLAAQLGGAAGTLAAFGDRGPEVLRRLADELELAEPVLPWHTNRTRIAELGGALDTTAGVLGKIGLDVVLLAQTEVGEVREGPGGGSSTLPQKRNPVRSALARACAQMVNGYATVLSRSLVQEHERAAGAWHAEWEALSGALAYTGGAAHAIAEAVTSLEIDSTRMRANLDATNGLVVAERVSFLLAEWYGRAEGHEIAREAARRAAESGHTFETELRADERVALSDEELHDVLDPTTYLGSAEAFVDRTLELYGRKLPGRP
ncbi:MAG: 3-carboxy-cis,cis-muconate cycloisomerase [Gaiellaceae bacterium]